MFKHRYRLVVALLLFFAGMLNYMDRAALSVMAPLVKADLHLNDAQLGFLFSCFFVGYCLFCFIGGWGADKFGPRKVYAWAAAIWSVFCGATALVTGFWHLLIVRVLFGIGEGPMGTTTNKSIANWFPRKEIGRAVGFTNAGQPLDRRYRRAGGRSGWSGFRLAHRLRGYRPARSGLGMRIAVAVSR
jgi:MFS family permease